MAIVTEEDVYSGSFTAFPAGLRVLVVDNDLNCLSCLVRLLQDCHYRVTTCRGGADALSLLRSETKFDLVISDIYTPDIDGFKLLEIIQLEMDIPVIMMSKDASRDVVMKAIFMGACDYLVKPLRKEEISVIWQHVVRKNSKAFMLRPEINLSSHDYRNNNSNNKSITGEENCGSSSSHVRSGGQDEGSKNNIVSMKKPRMIWTHELHDQFVAAVNSIGLKGAVPKKILALMKVPSLTRENVASHLQKYRIYLRRKKENVGKKVCNMSSVQTMGSDTTASLQVVAYNPPVTNQLHSQSSVVSQVEMDEAHRLSAAAAGRTEDVGKKVCNISSVQTQNVMHPYMMGSDTTASLHVVTNQLYSQSSVVSQIEMDESRILSASAAGCGSGCGGCGCGCINGVPITYYNQSLCYGLQTPPPPPPQTSVIHGEEQEILLSMEREQGLNDNDETIHFSLPISSVIVDVGQSNNNQQQQQQQQQFGGCNLFSCYDRCSLDGTDQNASFATVGNNSYSEYTFPCYDSVFQPQHYNNIQEGLVGN